MKSKEQKKQTRLLERIAQSLERTNELLMLQLTPVAARQYEARLAKSRSRKSAAAALKPFAPR
jgi:hypothetical protein